MGFVPFQDTIRIEPVFLCGGQYVENVLHYICDATPDSTLANQLAALYVAWWDANRDVLFATGLSLQMVKWTILEDNDDPGGLFTEGLPLAGLVSQDMMPNNVSVAVSLLTNNRGRSYRGRIYHVQLLRTQVEGNTLTVGALNNIKTAYEEIMSFSTLVGPAVLGVASRVSGGVERVNGVITPVTSIKVDPVIDSQRRRLPGRGT